jgi:hypothetical protein
MGYIYIYVCVCVCLVLFRNGVDKNVPLLPSMCVCGVYRGYARSPFLYRLEKSRLISIIDLSISIYRGGFLDVVVEFTIVLSMEARSWVVMASVFGS